MNWVVWGLGVTAGVIAWTISGKFILAPIVSIGTRVIVGNMIGAKWM